jgi:hypothetical protein
MRYHLAFLLLLCVSCLKTQETLITHYMVCEEKKHLADPDDFRDPYDNCLMVQEEYIKSTEGCREICSSHCSSGNLSMGSIWTDFTGCHCSCQRDMKVHS